MTESKVYIKVDEQNRIIGCEGGYTEPDDLNGWIQIDEGVGDKFYLCQSHYFDGGLCTKTTPSVPRYKLVDGAPVLRSEDEIEADRLPSLRTAKHAEISAASEAAIYAGMDVETTQGTEHFSLTEKDQINLTTARNAVDKGAAVYPYHADGEMCRIFTATEINAISQASIAHIIYHTTYCNHLFDWIRRADAAELAGITYGTELPDDLAAHMQEILTQAATVAETGAVT
ncbi:DUF4376 domain-containing protein [Candidatus Agathobaculum pullicola]|uniref:DUF4376 domain-containing protein n=1 Tax=Candidatus Agathobaculum pullicola TaxID=2838426 RepID=UPI003F916F2B